ncbi:MAG: FIST C-terminal domain-containing protein [Anaerolineae bacterium]|nr:FIST C-terminal domain-containing protein [Anaerolineae bacterium]
MKLATFFYHPQSGWSVAQLPPLDSPHTLVLIFGAPEFLHSPTAIAELIAAYPNSHIIGCSTSGEIFGTLIYDHSLSVAVARFEDTALSTVHIPITSASESFSAGEAIARQLQNPSLQGVFILSDGSSDHVNGSQLVNGLNAVLPDSVVVTGGLAGDGDRFGQTWVIKDGVPCSGYISAVGFYGDHIIIGHGSKGGWNIFGPERRVTRSEGNILYELDGKPALQLYKEYLGERAADLPASALLFPLALRASVDDDKQVVRTILGVDESKQSMIFAGDLPEGHLAQLMRASFNGLVDGASQAAAMARNQTPDTGNVLAIAISCVGRRLVMGEYAEDELEAVLDGLPHGVRQVGFYSYGEISPFSPGYCDLHNQTMTLTTISEI